MVGFSDRGLLLEPFSGCCRWMCVSGVALSMAVEDLHAEGRRVLAVLIRHRSVVGKRCSRGSHYPGRPQSALHPSKRDK